jgi:hypothetical protein
MSSIWLSISHDSRLLKRFWRVLPVLLFLQPERSHQTLSLSNLSHPAGWRATAFSVEAACVGRRGQRGQRGGEQQRWRGFLCEVGASYCFSLWQGTALLWQYVPTKRFAELEWWVSFLAILEFATSIHCYTLCVYGCMVVFLCATWHLVKRLKHVVLPSESPLSGLS